MKTSLIFTSINRYVHYLCYHTYRGTKNIENAMHFPCAVKCVNNEIAWEQCSFPLWTRISLNLGSIIHRFSLKFRNVFPLFMVIKFMCSYDCWNYVEMLIITALYSLKRLFNKVIKEIKSVNILRNEKKSFFQFHQKSYKNDEYSIVD